MQQLDLESTFESNFSEEQKAEIEKYKKQTEAKKLNYLSEANLLNEIRKGNRDAIPQLVDSWEYVIVDVIEKQIINKQVPIGKMIAVSKNALTILAERELGSNGRRIFFRFGVWWLYQSLRKSVA